MTGNAKAFAIAIVILFTLSWFGKTGYKIALVATVVLGILFFLKGLSTRGLAL